MPSIPRPRARHPVDRGAGCGLNNGGRATARPSKLAELGQGSGGTIAAVTDGW